jgi:hypothetical protein
MADALFNESWCGFGEPASGEVFVSRGICLALLKLRNPLLLIGERLAAIRGFDGLTIPLAVHHNIHVPLVAAFVDASERQTDCDRSSRRC